jgi:hypothetical protein
MKVLKKSYYRSCQNNNVMRILLALTFLLPTFFSSAQPFRYLSGNEIERDSIKRLGIKQYKEFIAPFDDSSSKTLVRIVEYDTNGNLTRDWRFDPITKNQNQYTYRYSSTNLLLESATYFPDSLTYFQRFIHNFDSAGNEIESITENYHEGKLTSTAKIIRTYDSKNQLTELKGISTDGTTNAHYGYVYNEYGSRIEEITYNNDGTIRYRRAADNGSSEREEAYGFPTDPNPELEVLFKEITTYLPDGNRKVEDGFGYRIFDLNNVLIYWEEKNYRMHWFEYAYY